MRLPSQKWYIECGPDVSGPDAGDAAMADDNALDVREQARADAAADEPFALADVKVSGPLSEGMGGMMRHLKFALNDVRYELSHRRPKPTAAEYEPGPAGRVRALDRGEAVRLRVRAKDHARHHREKLVKVEAKRKRHAARAEHALAQASKTARDAFDDAVTRKGPVHREVFSAAVNYGAALVTEDSKNAKMRAAAKQALEQKHETEEQELKERVEAKRTSARKTKLIDRKKGMIALERVALEIAKEEKALRARHWDELLVTKWGRAVLEIRMEARHADELTQFAKNAVEERFAARTSVLVMQKLEVDLKNRERDLYEAQRAAWEATPWGKVEEPEAAAPPALGALVEVRGPGATFPARVAGVYADAVDVLYEDGKFEARVPLARLRAEEVEQEPLTTLEQAQVFLREQHRRCKTHRGPDDHITSKLARNLAVALLRSEAATTEMQCEAEALLEEVVRASSDWSQGALAGSTVGPDWSVRAETSLVENSIDEYDVPDGARFAQLVLLDPNFELGRMPAVADHSLIDVSCVKCSAAARRAAGETAPCFCDVFWREPGDERPPPPPLPPQEGSGALYAADAADAAIVAEIARLEATPCYFMAPLRRGRSWFGRAERREQVELERQEALLDSSSEDESQEEDDEPPQPSPSPPRRAPSPPPPAHRSYW